MSSTIARRGATPQEQMSREQARAATDEVRRDVGKLWAKVLELYEHGAHFALGYETWGAYWQGEFGQSGARGEQLLRAGRVARELDRAELPLPANDLTARALAPMLRQAPEKLPELWRRALDQSEQPNARQLRALVAPYRGGDGRRGSAGHTPAARELAASTRRKRGTMTRALDEARAAAEAASVAAEDALSTGPGERMLAEWQGQLEQTVRTLQTLADALR